MIVCGLKSIQLPVLRARAGEICQHIEKKLSDVNKILGGRIGLLQLFSDFVTALSQVSKTKLCNFKINCIQSSFCCLLC